MPSPIVSCIMPTKNRRRFVERAVEMFAHQVGVFRGEAELIFLEDGEEDCSDIAAWLKGVHLAEYVRYEGTLGAKLNEGARLARGKYIIRWDDDDYQQPDRIANTIKAFELTGAKMLAMSSMLYYREGDKTGWEWTGNHGFDGTGSGHSFEREWALANLHPEINIGEDNVIREAAQKQSVLSCISGTQWVIACTHGNHCTAREMPNETAMFKQYGLIADNWREIPANQFSWVQKWALEQVPA